MGDANQALHARRSLARATRSALRRRLGWRRQCVLKGSWGLWCVREMDETRRRRVCCSVTTGCQPGGNVTAEAAPPLHLWPLMRRSGFIKGSSVTARGWSRQCVIQVFGGKGEGRRARKRGSPGVSARKGVAARRCCLRIQDVGAHDFESPTNCLGSALSTFGNLTTADCATLTAPPTHPPKKVQRTSAHDSSRTQD